MLSVPEERALAWLPRAAQKVQQINTPLLRELPVTQAPLDEMWNFVRSKHAQEAPDAKERTQDSPDGRPWIWIRYAPECRLRRAAFVGPRTAESALTLLRLTAAIVLGVPCCFSDGFSCYLPALLACYSTLKECARTGKGGRPRKAVQEAHPDLVSAQSVKHKEKGRLQTLSETVVCGAQRLKALGRKIRTNLLERLNLTLRQALAPLLR